MSRRLFLEITNRFLQTPLRPRRPWKRSQMLLLTILFARAVPVMNGERRISIRMIMLLTYSPSLSLQGRSDGSLFGCYCIISRRQVDVNRERSMAIQKNWTSSCSCANELSSVVFPNWVFLFSRPIMSNPKWYSIHYGRIDLVSHVGLRGVFGDKAIARWREGGHQFPVAMCLAVTNAIMQVWGVVFGLSASGKARLVVLVCLSVAPREMVIQKRHTCSLDVLIIFLNLCIWCYRLIDILRASNSLC